MTSLTGKSASSMLSRNLFLLLAFVFFVLSTGCASRRTEEGDPVATDDKQYVLPTAKRIR